MSSASRRLPSATRSYSRSTPTCRKPSFSYTWMARALSSRRVDGQAMVPAHIDEPGEERAHGIAAHAAPIHRRRDEDVDGRREVVGVGLLPVLDTADDTPSSTIAKVIAPVSFRRSHSSRRHHCATSGCSRIARSAGASEATAGRRVTRRPGRVDRLPSASCETLMCAAYQTRRVPRRDDHRPSGMEARRMRSAVLWYHTD